MKTDNNTSFALDAINRNFLCGVVEGFYGRPWTTEQREELFSRMKFMGLNTYLYAPKDDRKHRAFWRDLYSVEEAEHLRTLICAATEQDICFIYAISPGLDVTFSNNKDTTILKRKLSQVQALGCSSFALLFDDIEPELSPMDKEVFQSFGHAQVALTNDVFQSLSTPQHFLFCPTEYCAIRAVPNVSSSEYLKILGTKLLPGIDIMWTGPKVVSRNISVESIRELADVLQRPPLIWDNIHANDYDQKRLFLGPYKGRSPELIPLLRGVMTNPNCEFEANYVALHTLGQWAQSSRENVQHDILLSTSPVRRDIQLETEDDCNDYEKLHIAYDPRRALRVALHDWLAHFYDEKSFVKIVTNHSASLSVCPLIPASVFSTSMIHGSVTLSTPVAGVNTCMNTCTATTTTTITSAVSCVSTAASLVSVLGVPITGESMEYSLAGTPIGSVILASESSSAAPSPYCINDYVELAASPDIEVVSTGSNGTDAGMQVDSASMPDVCVGMDEQSVVDESDNERLSVDDLLLLVDLFYLPYEHGAEAVHVLEDFQWLKCNAHVLSQNGLDGETLTETIQWRERAQNFHKYTNRVFALSKKMTLISNRSIFYDIAPYLWDIRGVLSTLNSYLKWLALGQVAFMSVCFLRRYLTWCSPGYKVMFGSGDHEPWMFRGGLTAELQRMLPLESAQDLFPLRPPDVQSYTRVYKVRMYHSSDKLQLYDVCAKNLLRYHHDYYEQRQENSCAASTEDQLPGDCLLGAFLVHCADYCFVLEDEAGVCGFCVAALETAKFHALLTQDYLPLMRLKYPRAAQANLLETYFLETLQSQRALPAHLSERYPSLIRLESAPSRCDEPGALHRLLACACAALKTNGSVGVHALLSPEKLDSNCVSIHGWQLDFYKKYGFVEMSKAAAIDVEPSAERASIGTSSSTPLTSDLTLQLMVCRSI